MKDLETTTELTREDVSVLILNAKKRMGLTWEQISEGIAMSPVWTHLAWVGMNAMPPEKADAIAEQLDLPAGAADVLAEGPTKVCL